MTIMSAKIVIFLLTAPLQTAKEDGKLFETKVESLLAEEASNYLNITLPV